MRKDLDKPYPETGLNCLEWTQDPDVFANLHHMKIKEFGKRCLAKPVIPKHYMEAMETDNGPVNGASQIADTLAETGHMPPFPPFGGMPSAMA